MCIHITMMKRQHNGRMIKRVHPDAGSTNLQYDLASNLIEKQTENLALSSASIKYFYKFSRLMKIRYPLHPENNVTYSYDAAGRIAVRQDGTGSEEFLYDKLGNLAQSLRRIVIPTENNAYMFLTRFTYDSFGRMKSIRYPDGEWVQYAYTTGGLLKSVIGQKQGATRKYLSDRKYDAQGRVVEQTYGNNVQTQHVYDPQRQWLSHVSTFSNDTQDWLQDITYQYDAAGNITDIDQSAPPVSNGLGGKYDNHYQYDKQYRLIASKGSGDFTYSFSANYSPTGRFGQKYTATKAFASDLLFGYDKSHLTHQPRTVYDSGNGTMNHFWDANGNLAQIIDCKHDAARLHEWDEENRLRFVLGEKYAGYYGYDANGERVYKLTGSSSMDDVNSGSIKAQAIFDDAVLYPNPYIVVTPKGYTKHYYAGTERLATIIGCGGFDEMTSAIDMLQTNHDWDIVESFSDYYLNEDPFNYKQIISNSEPTEDIFGNANPDLEYQCQPTELVLVDMYTSQDILLGSISSSEPVFSEEYDIYFYHGDHLGSANWITDGGGNPIQYIHYAPYGEQIANQTPYGYDERFKFTGKERDAETGYDYFGARFYWSADGIFTTVDPLADKYPNVTPYLYCNGNPIMLVDPDGRAVFASAQDLQAAGMRVINDPNLQRKGKQTFCNIGAQAINRIGGDVSVRGRANEMGLYLRNPENATPISSEMALEYANRGVVVFASYVCSDNSEPGHIAVVAPTESLSYSNQRGEYVVSVFNVGATNGLMTLSQAFGKREVGLFVLNTDLQQINSSFITMELPIIEVLGTFPVVNHSSRLLEIIPIKIIDIILLQNENH